MAAFGVEVQRCKETYDFFAETKRRMQDDNLVRNPFHGDIKRIDNLFVVYMEPIYTNFTMIFWVIALGILIISGPTLWILLPASFGLLRFFWTLWFFYLFMVLGLRKKGYKGPVKLVRGEKLIKRCLFDGTGGSPSMAEGTEEEEQ